MIIEYFRPSYHLNMVLFSTIADWRDQWGVAGWGTLAKIIMLSLFKLFEVNWHYAYIEQVQGGTKQFLS